MVWNVNRTRLIQSGDQPIKAQLPVWAPSGIKTNHLPLSTWDYLTTIPKSLDAWAVGLPRKRSNESSRSKGSRSYERMAEMNKALVLRLRVRATVLNSYSHEDELVSTCNRANFSLKRLPTVEENSYVHWLGSCISFRSTSSNWLKKHKDSWLQHCEFWCPKTACFRGMFLHPPQWKRWASACDANTNMNCFSGSQFSMNHQSHSLSEIQIWTWPEHLPITALRCCHSSSSGKIWYNTHQRVAKEGSA